MSMSLLRPRNEGDYQRRAAVESHKCVSQSGRCLCDSWPMQGGWLTLRSPAPCDDRRGSLLSPWATNPLHPHRPFFNVELPSQCLAPPGMLAEKERGVKIEGASIVVKCLIYYAFLTGKKKNTQNTPPQYLLCHLSKQPSRPHLGEGEERGPASSSLPGTCFSQQAVRKPLPGIQQVPRPSSCSNTQAQFKGGFLGAQTRNKKL